VCVCVCVCVCLCVCVCVCVLSLNTMLDMDACALQPCNDRADCVDDAGGGTGATCECKEYIGWTGVGGLDGASCTGEIRLHV
jgi:hypothetical protein